MNSWDLLTQDFRRPLTGSVICALFGSVALGIVMGAALFVFDLPELIALGAGLLALSVTVTAVSIALKRAGM